VERLFLKEPTSAAQSAKREGWDGKKKPADGKRQTNLPQHIAGKMRVIPHISLADQIDIHAKAEFYAGDDSRADHTWNPSAAPFPAKANPVHQAQAHAASQCHGNVTSSAPKQFE
jgi:hypothetical protein